MNEKDAYRNNSFLGKLDNQLNDYLEFEGTIRLRDTYLQYDKVVDTATATHSEEERMEDIILQVELVYKAK